MAPSTPAPKERLAVALRYEHERDPAPTVIAKGKGPIAEQIMRLAEEHGLPVRENAELAAMIHRVELDHAIPVEAYVAVAEILSYIYRARGAGPAKTP